MNSIDINGYGDNLTVNGIRIGDLTPSEHEKIEIEKSNIRKPKSYIKNSNLKKYAHQKVTINPT